MREARLPAQQPIYRVRQFVFCLVERAFGCCSIILAHLVGCEDGFLRCDPLPGSIKDCGFGIFHEPILAALNIGVGAVSDCLVPFAPEYRREPKSPMIASPAANNLGLASQLLNLIRHCMYNPYHISAVARM
jgi:hypothetical protein